MFDVRDLAEWIVKLAETRTTGTFNAVGPARPLAWGDFLNACIANAKGKETKLEWVSADFLESQQVELPVWTPAVGEYAGFHQRSNARAVAAGLTYRPIADTIAATSAWWPKEVARRQRVTQE